MKTFEEIMANESTENLKKAIWVNKIITDIESDTREEFIKQTTRTDINYENGVGVISESISKHFSIVFDKENKIRTEKEYSVDNFGKITDKNTIVDEFDDLGRCIKQTILGDNDIPVSTTYEKYHENTDILTERIEKNNVTKVTTMFDRDSNPTIEETVTIKSGIRLVTKEYSYNEQGDIIKLKRPKTFTKFSYVYDINKNILSKTTKIFNNNGKLLKKVTCNYNSNGTIRSRIINDIVVYKSVYDTKGKLLRSINHDDKRGITFDRVFESYIDKDTNHAIEIMRLKTIYDTGRFTEKVIKSELSEDGLLLSECEDNTKVVTHEYDDDGKEVKTIMKKVVNGEFIVYRTVVTEYEDSDNYVSTEYDKDNNVLRKKIKKRDVYDNTTEYNEVLLAYGNYDNKGEEYVLDETKLFDGFEKF